jgi:predicted ester cyclase
MQGSNESSTTGTTPSTSSKSSATPRPTSDRLDKNGPSSGASGAAAAPPAASNKKTNSNEAMKVLRGYYDSFNKHEIAAAVGFLASDVKVRFPDETKNWATAEAAYDRYATMFRKSPNLKGKFSLLDIVHEGARTTITVYCHFTCSVSGVDTVREMVYIIQDRRIQIIDNKY